MVILDRRWYQVLLGDLYTSIEALDVNAYRWEDSDGWLRARSGPGVDAAPNHHLEVWINLGNPSRNGSMQEHAARATYSVLYQPEDDAMSQGVLHASIADLLNLLTYWGRADGVRSGGPLSATVEAVAGGWLVVEVSFTIRYPWRA